MPILKRGSQVRFPKGTRTAQGEFRIPVISPNRRIDYSMHIIGQTLALEDAIRNFTAEHGRPPWFESLLIRGGHTTTSVIVEIGEVSDDE